METKLEQAIQIMGIMARTTNQAEMSGEGKILGLWEKFYGQGINEKISAQSSDERVYALYTEYETDENGEYTILIGRPVEQVEEVPEGMVLKTIPASKYVGHTTEEGPLAKVAIETWQQIWQNEELRKKRSYSVDYELHDARSKDPENACIEIYIGVRD